MSLARRNPCQYNLRAFPSTAGLPLSAVLILVLSGGFKQATSYLQDYDVVLVHPTSGRTRKGLRRR